MDRDLELKRRIDARIGDLWGREHVGFPGLHQKLKWNVWTYPDENLLVRFQVPLSHNRERVDFFLHAEHIDKLSDAELLKEIEIQRAMILIAG